MTFSGQIEHIEKHKEGRDMNNAALMTCWVAEHNMERAMEAPSHAHHPCVKEFPLLDLVHHTEHGHKHQTRWTTGEKIMRKTDERKPHSSLWVLRIGKASALCFFFHCPHEGVAGRGCKKRLC